MFYKEYGAEIAANLLSRNDFKPFPQYEDRKGWEDVPEEFRAFLLEEARQYENYEWPSMPATYYMDFYRNGNRTRYEDRLFFQHRRPLIYLVAAECCEGKGRLIDDIINGVWATLEETTWVVPAHNAQLQPDLPLPHLDEIEIDLFSAECGAILSWVYYELGNYFEKELPQLRTRLLYELDRRIFKPFLKHNDFSWMGYRSKSAEKWNQGVNNWNPWIMSNVMTAAGFACMNEEDRKKIILKCVECFEFFVEGYTPDGGCNEGPEYWDLAGGSLFDDLTILYDLTDGKVDMMNNDFVRNVCSYIYKMHIDRDFYVNYADARQHFNINAEMAYRMGKYTHDEKQVQFGVALFHEQKSRGVGYMLSRSSCQVYQVYRHAKQIFINKELAAEPVCGFPYVRDMWFPGIQIMAARMNGGDGRGLFFSAKGGHNAENHNHNDVGSFVLYCDGKPIVIDLGIGTYEKRTFSSQRYELPQNQSQYHNLPIVAGCGQLPGHEYAAQDVFYSTGENDRFSLDLRKAYGEEAGIESWKRSYDVDRTRKTVTLTDDFRLKKAEDVTFVFMSKAYPEAADGVLTLTADDETQVTMTYDPSLKTVVEVFDTSKDAEFRAGWGDCVYRIKMTLPAPAAEGKFCFTFAKK